MSFRYAPALIAACSLSSPALAQRVGDNAVSNADDAFGTNVGLEQSGIYNENDTRGFSPAKAGNIRADGIYIDPTGTVSGRLRQSTSIRVGFAAEQYPFAAPTGIVDHQFRPFPAKNGMSVGMTQTGHNGVIAELDLRFRDHAGRFGFIGGFAYADNRFNDGTSQVGWGWTARPMLRLGGTEMTLIAGRGGFDQVRNRTVVVVTGNQLPNFPASRTYIGQPWVHGRSKSDVYGATLKSVISPALSLRGGIFHNASDRLENYSEIFQIVDSAGNANHRVIADPPQDVRSTSGEVQVAYKFGDERVQHRLIAGFRARHRYTETGGSDVLRASDGCTPSPTSTCVTNLVPYGNQHVIPLRAFNFTKVNQGDVHQRAFMLGYIGSVKGLGSLNLGIQKARYDASALNGLTGFVTTSRDEPWLYNASLGIDLSSNVSFYLGTEKGLEDSGIAPDSAVNRNDQLPATRTTQYEGGLRWKFHGGQLVVNAFQITKPYFSYNATGTFAELGLVRHRGVESSLSGTFGKRLHVVAGAVLMQPRVTRHPGVTPQELGDRPTGTPSIFARADINYRTDLWGGLTPTASLIYTGARAVTARPVTATGEQLMVPHNLAIDLGVRRQFTVAGIPASVRAVVQNVFDSRTWKVVAANTMYPDEKRRFTMTLTADF